MNRNHKGATRTDPDGPPQAVVDRGITLLAALTAFVLDMSDGLAWLRMRAAADAYNREVNAALAAHPAGKGRQA